MVMMMMTNSYSLAFRFDVFFIIIIEAGIRSLTHWYRKYFVVAMLVVLTACAFIVVLTPDTTNKLPTFCTE